MTVYAAEDVQNEELTTAFQEDVQIGEENVETEIPTEGEEVIKSEEASLEAPTEETTPEETEEVLEEPAETEEEAEAEEVISVASDNSYGLGEQEYQILLKIVEAEAGGEDTTGKMLVANVVMNRVRSAQFPDTISEVVYERSEGRAQFSPTADGRIDKVTISSDTIEAVARVMSGEDVSAGALYFRAISSKEGWFDQSLNRVLEHGNHIFYTM
ncbi:MAG: cell wall hydrolase [Lachnospiraceae bacterium]|jgi:N-acetylmuramoyl-L-alanine amidase|nr:cell wall hydrolase [Lachnospiraceae bacterium]